MRQLQEMTFSEISKVVYQDWPTPSFYAAVAIDCLAETDHSESPQDCERIKNLVAMFMANAESWHGPVALIVKQFLIVLLLEIEEI